jgi:hypothetical protein
MFCFGLALGSAKVKIATFLTNLRHKNGKFAGGYNWRLIASNEICNAVDRSVEGNVHNGPTGRSKDFRDDLETK